VTYVVSLQKEKEVSGTLIPKNNATESDVFVCLKTGKHGCPVRHVGTLVRGLGSWDQICMGTTEAQGQLGQKSKQAFTSLHF
jgi:hypothetical protein